MLTDGLNMKPGNVVVQTTNNRGFTAEEWAEQMLNKIVYVAENSDSVIADQAHAFKEQIRDVCIFYIKKAIVSDRTTLYNLFMQQGHGDMAEILRRL